MEHILRVFSELSNLFLKEPGHFIEQLSMLNDEDRKIISFNIVHIMHMNEPELNKGFKDTLYGVKHRKEGTEFNVVLNDLIEEYEKIKKIMH